MTYDNFLRQSVMSITVVLCALTSSPALAADPARLHGSGHEHAKRLPKAHSPEVTLQAEAGTEVQQDTVRITLAAEVSDAQQSKVSESLGSAIKKAMAIAVERDDNVKVTSGNYRVWPMNDKDGHISNWRGRGEIYLESKDFDAASSLANLLSDTMAIASLSFFVSPQVRAAHEEQLLTKAAEAFRQRAMTVAQALGYSGYRLHKLNVGGSGAQFQYAPRAMPAMMAKSAADSMALEADTEMISVSIQGSIWLDDERK